MKRKREPRVPARSHTLLTETDGAGRVSVDEVLLAVVGLSMTKDVRRHRSPPALEAISEDNTFAIFGFAGSLISV